jgi:adenylyltransferase/sulfurtransferase
VQHLSYAELEQWRTDERPFVLIDVREPAEHAAYHIGGELIPLAQVVRQREFPTDRPVVFYCRKGIRSQIAIQRLAHRFPEADFYNLRGGISDLRHRLVDGNLSPE